MIKDHQRLIGVTNQFNRALPVYDDGDGPLWIHRNSTGITGIVRAASWSDAYEIFEDEMFPECDLTMDEIKKEYGFKRETRQVINASVPPDDPDYVSASCRYVRDSDYVNGRLPDGKHSHWKTIETPDPEAWPDNELFQEAYGFRPNGPNVGDKIGHGIYDRDLNGDSLDLLTARLAEELGLTVDVEDEE